MYFISLFGHVALTKILQLHHVYFKQKFIIIYFYIIIIITVLEPIVISLCHQYQARPACTSVQSD